MKISPIFIFICASVTIFALLAIYQSDDKVSEHDTNNGNESIEIIAKDNSPEISNVDYKFLKMANDTIQYKECKELLKSFSKDQKITKNERNAYWQCVENNQPDYKEEFFDGQ